jgi:hypothetical protein
MFRADVMPMRNCPNCAAMSWNCARMNWNSGGWRNCFAATSATRNCRNGETKKRSEN